METLEAEEINCHGEGEQITKELVSSAKTDSFYLKNVLNMEAINRFNKFKRMSTAPNITKKQAIVE